MIGAFIIQIVLIAVNALFASSEIAVISMSEARLKILSEEGDKRAGRLLNLTRQPAKFLATIQVAITLAGLLGGAFAAENFADPIVDLILSLGVSAPRTALHSAVVFLITLVLTYFSIVFGELVPKRLAMKKTEALSLQLSGILYFMSKLCAPLVWLLTVSTNALLRLLGIDPNQNEEVVTEDEIKMMLMEGSQQGTIENDENEIIQNVFDMNDTSAEEVSTRRRDVVCLYLEDDMSVWAGTIRNSHYTYFPVCGESQDDVVGVLNTKDYFRLDDLSRKSVMKNAVDKPFFVPEGIRADQLFSRMKQERKYFAIVIDEYGGMSGIVTVHDLMEELVGDMDDEDTVREVEMRLGRPGRGGRKAGRPAAHRRARDLQRPGLRHRGPRARRGRAVQLRGLRPEDRRQKRDRPPGGHRPGGKDPQALRRCGGGKREVNARQKGARRQSAAGPLDFAPKYGIIDP